MPWPKEMVTLVAALIAATASLGSLLISLLEKRRSELREAQRAALEPIVVELGNATYSVIAISKRLGNSREDVRYKANKEKATATSRDLDQIRRKVRYTLWGLNDGLHTLVLLPRWIEFTRGDKEASERLVELATDLREAIDDEIRRCYLAGRSPSARGLKRVKACDAAVRSFYNRHKRSPIDGSDEFDDDQ